MSEQNTRTPDGEQDFAGSPRTDAMFPGDRPAGRTRAPAGPPDLQMTVSPAGKC
jgi:hypothetical protein